MRDSDLIRFCPQCKKPIEPSFILNREFSFARIELPYFVCSDCCIIGIDKALLQKTISLWRNGGAAQGFSYWEIYRRVKSILEQHIQYYIDNADYKLYRFQKS